MFSHEDMLTSYKLNCCPTSGDRCSRTRSPWLTSAVASRVSSPRKRRGTLEAAAFDDSNLVDSASSHTLVSKIKPCTSENKEFSLNLRMAHYISYSLFDSPLLHG